MGVNTSDLEQVRSVALLKFGLNVKFYGTQLLRPIKDYPTLLKHDVKVWIVSKEFENVKPAADTAIRYSNRFWNRYSRSTRNCGKFDEDQRYSARVMPSTKSCRNLKLMEPKMMEEANTPV